MLMYVLMQQPSLLRAVCRKLRQADGQDPDDTAPKHSLPFDDRVESELMRKVTTAHVSPSSFLAHEIEVERAAVSFLQLSAMSMTPWAYPEEH